MKNFDKNILGLLIFGVILAVCWVGFTLYFNREGESVSPNSESFTEYIDPTFDTETINLVKNKIVDLPVPPSIIREVEEIIPDTVTE